MKIKTLLLTLLISTSLIGTAQALTFVNSNNKSASSTKVATNNERAPYIGPVKINIHDEYQTNNFSGLVELEFAHGIRLSSFGYPIIPLIDVNDDGHQDLIFQTTPPWMGTVEVIQNSANMVVSLYDAEWKEYDIIDTIESPNTTFGHYRSYGYC